MWIRLHNDYEVSILILLELPFDAFEEFKAENDKRRFQSLFYWNCRLIFLARNPNYIGRRSFNPYFIGIAV